MKPIVRDAGNEAVARRIASQRQMAANNDSEQVADPGGSVASQKKRRFWQFSMRQLLLLLALSGALLGALAPEIHQTLRLRHLEQNGRRIAAANNDLMEAVRTNNLSVARRALDVGADPDLGILTCIAKGHVEMLKLLLDLGADPEGTPFRGPLGGGAPLLSAAACDQPPEIRCQMVRLLVEAGADPQRQQGRYNAMDHAVHLLDSQMGDLLREYGLPYGPREMAAFNRLDELRQAIHDDPDLLKQRFRSYWATTGPADEPTLLAIALYQAYREMSLFLIDAGAPLDTRQHLGRTLLHEAAIGGDPELIRLLVARGLDVNAIDDHFKDTPLEYAAGYDKREAVAMLLQAGADVNHQDGSGRTHLHAAVSGKRLEVIHMLPAAGADPTIADIKGETPLDLARARNPAMVHLLEPAAEKSPKQP
jgi:ankyrin repeat protein